MGSSNRTMSPKMKPSTESVSIEPAAFDAAALPDDALRSTSGELAFRAAAVSIGLAIALGIIIAYGGKAHLHWPDFSVLEDQPWVLKLHIAGAATALVIGTGLMFGPKGTSIHRAFGWTWVVAMMTTALSSFFLHFIHPGGFSPIHALSAYVAVGVPMGVAFARRHNIKAHRRMMTGNFLFGLIIAGAFTFVPGRLMWKVFFG